LSSFRKRPVTTAYSSVLKGMNRLHLALVLSAALVPASFLVAGCEEKKAEVAPDSSTRLTATTPATPTANPSASTQLYVPPAVADASVGAAATDAGAPTTGGGPAAKTDGGTDAGKPATKK
jgi:hypothetical protein